ncbi:tryptophanyl-tRNA synthetase [Gregarina niphandrodes]|uniref:Tryptophan--tRNA ligase, cytoplasmic n=1 Tax=Gregarina niphandrodes TaxID=110365 RepID=A0A023B836_GRENI|nr:tryptophanyl-tRNA synthetase [Gregarina niphandrodes]EZG68176.1 tryptophanyl-tRNA synthetase [Gregarina niphandrodes]|eukprot:XP_011130070.1 tryptophanyl-tRNA synthetase [Gregarina niphandrodes]
MSSPGQSVHPEIKGESNGEEYSKVTPWEVQGGADGINYDRLVDQFGCEKLTPELIERFKKVTGTELHPFLRRGLFFAHRDLDTILKAKEEGKPFYLYTGRGPSSDSLHVGHLVPFMMIKWLQEVFDCPLVIQLTDDEKFLFKEGLSLEDCQEYGFENAKDILAVGFNAEKTFIFRDVDYIQDLYPTTLKIQKKTTFNQVKGIFGFNESTNIGSIMYPAIQCAPCFPSAFPRFLGDPSITSKCMRCLVPYAIDQDPYFRMTRDVAPRLGWEKNSSLISKFIPALHGSESKMSASGPNSAVFLTDTPKQIKTKINKYAFSGGKDTAEEQRKYGANLEVDVSYQYLKVFLDDDIELEDIGRKYSSGELLTGEIKAKLIQVLQDLVAKHQQARSKITNDVVRHYFNPDRPALRRQIEEACKVYLATSKNSDHKAEMKKDGKGKKTKSNHKQPDDE